MEYVHLIVQPPQPQRYAADDTDLFSWLVDRATGCVIDRTASPVCLDLIVGGATYRFEFCSDEDLQNALQLVTTRCLPLNDHGSIVKMLVISICSGLLILAVLALAFQSA